MAAPRDRPAKSGVASHVLFQQALEEQCEQIRKRVLQAHEHEVKRLQADNEDLRHENVRLKQKSDPRADDDDVNAHKTSSLLFSPRYPRQPLLITADPDMPSAPPVSNDEDQVSLTIASPNHWESDYDSDYTQDGVIRSEIVLKWKSLYHGLAQAGITVCNPSKECFRSSIQLSRSTQIAQVGSREDIHAALVTEQLHYLLSHDRSRYVALVSRVWQPCVKLVSPPWSTTRLFFDSLSLVFIAYDVVMLPLLLAFGPLVESETTQLMELITAVFWSFDTPSQFFVGYYNRSSFLEMRPSHTVHRYLTGWFIFDGPVLILDWVFLGTSGQDLFVKGSRSGRTLRILRVLRAFKLVRLRKVSEITKHLGQLISSEAGKIMFQFLKLGFIILMINHAIGCGWYALGSGSSELDPVTQAMDKTGLVDDTKTGWVNQLDMSDEKVAYKYLTALHWSLTQFTPASMEIHPTTIPERIFAICTVLFGLMLFSSIISRLTSMMVQLRNLGTERYNQERKFRRFLQENNISLELAQHLWGTLNVGALLCEARVSESEVDFLKYISEPLSLELHSEMFMPALCRHPFFCAFAHANTQAMFRLCHSAVAHQSIPPGFEYFFKGELATFMAFIDRGVLRYSAQHRRTMGHHHIEGDVADVLVLEKHMWVCEAALWTTWVHCGYLVARTVCEIFKIDAAKFHNIARKAHPGVIRYQAYFNDYMHDTGVGFHEGISDFFGHIQKLEEFTEDSFNSLKSSPADASLSNGNRLHVQSGSSSAKKLDEDRNVFSGTLMDLGGSFMEFFGLRPEMVNEAMMAIEARRRISSRTTEF